MTETLLTTPTADKRPDHLPERFWDPNTQTVHLDQLIRAYLELERAGAPPTSKDYTIETSHPLLASDHELNDRLHQQGFSQDQAQLVYDLAAERVLPILEKLAEDYEAERQLERLIDHFNGEDRWREVSRQLLNWGRSNVPADVLEALSATAEGVIALHRMMTAGEGRQVTPPADSRALGEDDVRSLMRDPKYWKRRDPEMVRRVEAGFRRLYPTR